MKLAFSLAWGILDFLYEHDVQEYLNLLGGLEDCYIKMDSRVCLQGMGSQHGLCSMVAMGCLLCHRSVSIYCAPTSSYPQRHRSFSLVRGTCPCFVGVPHSLVYFLILHLLYPLSGILFARRQPVPASLGPTNPPPLPSTGPPSSTLP
jgi:hypothetical protein